MKMKRNYITMIKAKREAAERLERATNKAVLDAKASSIKEVEALKANQK